MSRSTRTPSEDEIQRLVLGPIIRAERQDINPVALQYYLRIRDLVAEVTYLVNRGSALSVINEKMCELAKQRSDFMDLLDANFASEPDIPRTVAKMMRNLLLVRLLKFENGLVRRPNNKMSVPTDTSDVTKGRIEDLYSMPAPLYSPPGRSIILGGSVSDAECFPAGKFSKLVVKNRHDSDAEDGAMDLVVEEVESDAGASNVTPAEDSIRQKDCMASGSIADEELADSSPSSATLDSSLTLSSATGNDEASDLPLPSDAVAEVVEEGGDLSDSDYIVFMDILAELLEAGEGGSDSFLASGADDLSGVAHVFEGLSLASMPLGSDEVDDALLRVDFTGFDGEDGIPEQDAIKTPAPVGGDFLEAFKRGGPVFSNYLEAAE